MTKAVMRRGFSLSGAGCVLAGVLVAVVILSMAPRGAGAAPTPPGFFVSVTGSDAGRCTKTAPCASFNRAYRVATAGNVVEVAGGLYPPQQVVNDPAKQGTKRVTFRPAPRASVVLGGLTLGTSVDTADGPRGLAIERMTIADQTGRQRGIAAFRGAENVLLEGIDAASFYLNDVKNFTISGGDWGPCLTTSTGTQSNHESDGCSNSKIDGTKNENIEIRGALIHDFRILPHSGAHFECLFVVQANGLKIRRNRFVNCEFFDIFFQNFGVPTQNVTIEQNWFDTPWNGNNVQNRSGSVEFSPRLKPFSNFRIIRNSFRGSGSINLNGDADGTHYANFTVERNIAYSYLGTCYSSATFLGNFWIPHNGSACNATERVRLFGYVPVDGALRPVPAEADAIRRIFRAISARQPARAIARTLLRERVPAPTGARWSGSVVLNIAKNEAYRGNRFGAAGAHPAIVTERSWRAAQVILRG